MRAAQVKEFSPNSVFQLSDIETPTIGDKEVLVKVAAAGIIYADVLERQGVYGPPEQPFPLTLGIEVAGTIEAVGKAVQRYAVGDRVAGNLDYAHHGGYAEYAAVRANNLRPIPERCSFAQAMVYMVNLPVAYHHFYTFGQVQPGETLLIHAASGGVGSLITQIAKRKGQDNTVIALASNEEKMAFCAANGADHCINYREVDYVEAVKELTQGRGVEVVCNSVGGDTLANDPKIIKPLRGRWLITGASNGAKSINPWSFIYDSITVKPFSVLTLPGTEEFRLAFQFLDQWLAEETLIDPTHVFSLEQATEAHQLIEQQKSFGKIILQP